MIIGYFNIVGISLMPPETYSPLIVNADAMLTFPIAGELFQPIPRRHPQVF